VWFQVFSKAVSQQFCFLHELAPSIIALKSPLLYCFFLRGFFPLIYFTSVSSDWTPPIFHNFLKVASPSALSNHMVILPVDTLLAPVPFFGRLLLIPRLAPNRESAASSNPFGYVLLFRDVSVFFSWSRATLASLVGPTSCFSHSWHPFFPWHPVVRLDSSGKNRSPMFLHTDTILPFVAGSHLLVF